MSFTRFASGLAALTVLAGCGSVQNAYVKDTSSPAYAVRATLRGGDADAGGRKRGPGVEIGYEGYRAEGTQTLNAGESIWLPGGAVFGPQTLSHTARVEQFYVAYNHRLRFGSSFELEPYVGVTSAKLKFETTPSGSSTAMLLDNRETGVTAGITPRWRFTDLVATEFRYNYIETHEFVRGSSYEVAVVVTPVPQVGLRLGWSDRRHFVKSDATPQVGSEVSIRARGPLATLQFDF
ncbi:MAG TPA: hypothetical protein VFL64_02740 [Rhizobacter sp.]|nr:hypothetical protein [Rhizobacter sp.]